MSEFILGLSIGMLVMVVVFVTADDVLKELAPRLLGKRLDEGEIIRDFVNRTQITGTAIVANKDFDLLADREGAALEPGYHIPHYWTSLGGWSIKSRHQEQFEKAVRAEVQKQRSEDEHTKGTDES